MESEVGLKMLLDAMTIASTFNLIFARITILLKLLISGVQMIQFRPKEVRNYQPIVLATDKHGLANGVPREIWIDDTASSKFTPNMIFLVEWWSEHTV